MAALSSALKAPDPFGAKGPPKDSGAKDSKSSALSILDETFRALPFAPKLSGACPLVFLKESRGFPEGPLKHPGERLGKTRGFQNFRGPFERLGKADGESRKA